MNNAHSMLVAASSVALVAYVLGVVSSESPAHIQNQLPPTVSFEDLQPLPVVASQRVAGILSPRDMITVFEGTPFAVPPGKLFVLTGVCRDSSVSGTNSLCTEVSVCVDSSPVLSVILGATRHYDSSVGQV